MSALTSILRIIKFNFIMTRTEHTKKFATLYIMKTKIQKNKIFENWSFWQKMRGRKIVNLLWKIFPCPIFHLNCVIYFLLFFPFEFCPRFLFSFFGAINSSKDRNLSAPHPTWIKSKKNKKGIHIFWGKLWSLKKICGEIANDRLIMTIWEN